MIPLTKLQKEIMTEFYSCGEFKVIYNKSDRDIIWKKVKAKQPVDIVSIGTKCPSLAHQIEKSWENGNCIQSAVFSECVYAQTLANIFGLIVFTNCIDNTDFIPDAVKKLLASYNLHPRYAYSNLDKTRMLIQAGGCNGIDSALITLIDLNIYTIEFKEQGAKTSEADLPKYKEDGKILITRDFIEKYPHFERMLNEQASLNFFDKMGFNEHNFSAESVNFAVKNNYAKKYADVVCTEDINGCLAMIPANQLSVWAKIAGEIRPAGRNHYNVWTPEALRNFLKKNGAAIINERVSIDKSNLGIRKARGGNKISGYKINPLFFVYIKDCVEANGNIEFDLNCVQQLNPTIAGKVFFDRLKYDDVKKYYNNCF